MATKKKTQCFGKVFGFLVRFNVSKIGSAQIIGLKHWEEQA